MEKTKIDWCDSSWNPVTGCLHSCKYCYARSIANRFSGGGEKWTDDALIELNDRIYFDESEKAEAYPYGFKPTLHRYRLNEYEKKGGRNIFVCSMADLFGHWVPDSWIEEVFSACAKAPQHNYLFLTKNPERFVDLQNNGKLIVADNMWYGASATNEDQLELAAKTFSDLNCQSLSEKIKERYRSMYTGVFYRRYILGLWAMAEGIIYDMFDTAKHVISNLSELTNANCYVSCDYGTQNATVFLLWCKDRLGRWVCCREYYYSGRDEERQKTDTEYADDLEQWLDGIKPVKIVIDPSAASFIAELKKRGYAIKKAKNDVLDGIRFVASLLNQGKIAISDQCPNTIKEFGSYIWDQKASERGEDKPVKQHDHAMDALRYFCYTIIRKPGSISILK